MTSRIAVLFLISGVLSLIFSIVLELQVVAIVGLGLTFWGALFLFLNPTKYVGGSVLSSNAVSFYSTIDRILKEYSFPEKCYYIPAAPREISLPDHLRGLRDATVFIPAGANSQTPSVEDLAQSKFRTKNPEGVLITSPGSELLNQIEKEADIDFSKPQLEQPYEILSRFLSENLNLAKEVSIIEEENMIHLKISGSLFKNLYKRENGFKSVRILGCPTASAVACAIAKTTGKPVTIERQKTSLDGLTVDVWFSVVQE